ncbi:MAG TPA: hypothetical protein PKC14_03260 [Candidatus Absconditabacterales bacterium]|nr:hypothetical protein [Candidatus Absconditabacterales bacterium]
MKTNTRALRELVKIRRILKKVRSSDWICRLDISNLMLNFLLIKDDILRKYLIKDLKRIFGIDQENEKNFSLSINLYDQKELIVFKLKKP